MDKILEPIDLPCGQVIPNRLCKSAMTERLSNSDYGVNEKHIKLYERWSQSYFGLHLSGNIIVDHKHLESAGNLIASSSEHVKGLKKMVDVVHHSGSAFWAQLSHAGRQTSYLVNTRPHSASNVWLKRGGFYLPPKAMTVSQIHNVIEKFAISAQVCIEAGFDGVQVHAAHGYLISQFLSPYTNHRTDEYGGSLENRSRLLLELIDRVRNSIGKSHAISVKLNSTDFQKGGFKEEDSIAVIKMLEGKIDLLEISGGTYEKQAMMGEHKSDSTQKREAYFMDFAQKIMAQRKMALMVTGGFRHRTVIDHALNSGVMEMAGLARPFCTHPDLMKSFLTGEIEELEDPFIPAKNSFLKFSSQGGYYAKQIINIANGDEPDLNMNGDQGGQFVMTHEMKKALTKRFFGKP